MSCGSAVPMRSCAQAFYAKYVRQREQYYTVAHKLREKIERQPEGLAFGELKPYQVLRSCSFVPGPNCHCTRAQQLCNCPNGSANPAGPAALRRALQHAIWAIIMEQGKLYLL